MAQAVFYGASGGKYVFEVYPLNAEFHNVGGINISTYRYVNQRSEVKYKPLYIGKTGSFSDRLTNAHEALDCVLNMISIIYVRIRIMTHLHARDLKLTFSIITTPHAMCNISKV